MDGKSAAYTGACRVWEWDERIYASSEVIVVIGMVLRVKGGGLLTVSAKSRDLVPAVKCAF